MTLNGLQPAVHGGRRLAQAAAFFGLPMANTRSDSSLMLVGSLSCEKRSLAWSVCIAGSITDNECVSMPAAIVASGVQVTPLSTLSSSFLAPVLMLLSHVTRLAPAVRDSQPFGLRMCTVVTRASAVPPW